MSQEKKNFMIYYAGVGQKTLVDYINCYSITEAFILFAHKFVEKDKIIPQIYKIRVFDAVCELGSNSRVQEILSDMAQKLNCYEYEKNENYIF